MHSRFTTCPRHGHLEWNKPKAGSKPEIFKFCKKCGNPVRNRLGRLC